MRKKSLKFTSLAFDLRVDFGLDQSPLPRPVTLHIALFQATKYYFVIAYVGILTQFQIGGGRKQARRSG